MALQYVLGKKKNNSLNNIDITRWISFDPIVVFDGVEIDFFRETFINKTPIYIPETRHDSHEIFPNMEIFIFFFYVL